MGSMWSALQSDYTGKKNAMKLSPLILIITPQPDGKGLFTLQM